MNKYLRILVFMLAAHGAVAVAASQALLKASSDNDQVPAALLTATGNAASVLERTPLQTSHAIDARDVLHGPLPYVAQSREYWSEIGETELRTGAKFVTTAPAALVRLSPRDSAGAALDPAGISVRARGISMRADAASSAIADTRALRAAGMDVPAGTLVLRLAPTLGTGPMEIAAPHARGRYLIHVFDPDSALVLGFGADRDTVLVGTTITFHATLGGAGLQIASGLVTAPDGYSADLDFARDADGGFSAHFTPDAAHAVGPQLWEAHVFATADAAGASIPRDAKTAFAVSAPTARFSGAAQSTADAAGLHMRFDVDASAASRYQVDGVLYATASDGRLRPIALAQSAAWLDAGHGSIELRFDADSINASGMHAPFELRDLRLIDQATMGLIERREQALAIN
jgi:hypothetical protein